MADPKKLRAELDELFVSLKTLSDTQMLDFLAEALGGKASTKTQQELARASYERYKDVTVNDVLAKYPQDREDLVNIAMFSNMKGAANKETVALFDLLFKIYLHMKGIRS